MLTSRDLRQKDPSVTCGYKVVGANLNRDVENIKDVNGVFGMDPDGNVWFIPMTRRNLLMAFEDHRDAKTNEWKPDLFQGFIFFGYGPEVKQQVLELHRQVDDVLGVNSGAQQGPYWTRVTGADGVEIWEDDQLRERDKVIRSVVLAMMGGHLLKEPGEDTGADTNAGRRPPTAV